MVPSEENPVVGVRRAAARVLDHVVDFAPLGSDVAARDDAATVAKADGTPLVVAEHPFQRAELHDPACVVEHNPLHPSGASDVPRSGQRDRLGDSAYVSESATGLEVFSPHRDNERRG